MAHSFIDLDKAVIHVIKLVSDDCVALEQQAAKRRYPTPRSEVGAVRRYPRSKIRGTSRVLLDQP